VAMDAHPLVTSIRAHERTIARNCFTEIMIHSPLTIRQVFSDVPLHQLT
jgi:hypothetical protein